MNAANKRYRVLKKSSGPNDVPPVETQTLILETLNYWGFSSSKIIDTEEIPLWVIAARATGTPDWTSKFAPFDEFGILPKNHPKYPIN